MWRDVTSWDGSWSGSGDVIVGLHGRNRIRRVSPDTLVITVKFDGSQLLALDLKDEASDPQCFFGCMCLCDILRFST